MNQIIFISMPNCGSCRKLENALDYSGIEIPEHKIIDPSNEDDLEWANNLNIITFPTIIKLDENGKEISRLTGLQPLTKIRQFLID